MFQFALSISISWLQNYTTWKWFQRLSQIAHVRKESRRWREISWANEGAHCGQLEISSGIHPNQNSGKLTLEVFHERPNRLGHHLRVYNTNTCLQVSERSGAGSTLWADGKDSFIWSTTRKLQTSILAPSKLPRYRWGGALTTQGQFQPRWLWQPHSVSLCHSLAVFCHINPSHKSTFLLHRCQLANYAHAVWPWIRQKDT